MQSLSIYSTLDIAICAYATLYGCQEECQDRFFEFILLQSATAESVGTAVKEHLATILPEDQKSKLICQVYGGGRNEG